MRHDVGHAIATPQQRVAKQATDEAYMNYFGRQRTKTRRKRLLKVLPFFVFLRVVFFFNKKELEFPLRVLEETLVKAGTDYMLGELFIFNAES